VTGAEFSEVDIDLLADYVGGALTGTPDEAEVAARVAGDPTWRAAHDELAAAMTSVGAELSALGAAAEPMPADLAARLDAAFASAAADPVLIDPAAPATPSGDAAEPGAASERHLSAVPDAVDHLVRRPTRAGRRRRLRWAAPIAAAAGVIAFFGVGINYLQSQSNSSADSKTAAAGSGALNAPILSSGEAVAPGKVSDQQIFASGRDYAPATLGSRVSAGLVQTAPLPDSSMVPQIESERPLDRLLPAAALQACLDAIAQANATGVIAAQTVDYARFEGNPALIVRFAASNGVWVWATGPDCGSSGVGAAKLDSVRVG